MNRRSCAALALLAASCTASSLAAQELKLVDALTFSADSLVKGAAVRIGNPGANPVVITAIGIDSVRSAFGVAEPKLKVSLPTNLTIAAGDTIAVPLRGAAAWLEAEPGPYTAHISWTHAAGPLRGRLAVTAGALVRPLATSLKLRPNGFWPVGSFSADVEIPVRGGVRNPSPGAFALVMQDGTPAVGRVVGVGGWSADTSVSAYRVRLSNLRGGRTYTGSIPLVLGDDASSAPVTVEARDPVIWVLLVVVIGVVVGVYFRKWMNVGQAASLLRERELLLGERFDLALRELAAAEGATDPLREEIRRVREALEVRLKELGRRLTRDTAGFESVEKQIGELETQAGTIREIARVRGQLKATLATAVQVAGPKPPPEEAGDLEDRPNLVIAGQGLVEREVELKTVVDHRDELAAMHTVLGRWIVVYQELRRKQGWLERLRVDATSAELEALQPVAAELRKVRYVLWDVKDEAEFTRRDPAATVDTIEESLRVIADNRVAAMRGNERLHLSAMLVQPASVADTESAARGTLPAALPAPDQTALAARVRQLRGLTDLTLGIAAFVVATLIMLGTEYLDHPFGTLAHYGKALGWAFTTTAGMDLISVGLASLRPILTRIATR